MPASGPRVRLIGELQAPELAPAVAWLKSHARCTLGDRPRQPDPDAIVFCVARPGQISRAVVDDFHRVHPLCRMLALLGPWCEGEVRSGKPWPGVTRIYWHQWQARLPEELARLADSVAPPVPRSATEVDALLGRPAPQRASRARLIGVASRRRTDFEAIALALSSEGHHPVWIAADDALPVLNLDALVVDADQDLSAAVATWQAVAARSGSLPAVLLAHFPRPEEMPAVSGGLGPMILAKPFLVADLLDRVHTLLSAAESSDLGSAAA